MSETIEQICQRVQEARGYLVLARDRPSKIGEIVSRVEDPEYPLDAIMVVISETDKADADVQATIMWGANCVVNTYPYYYRVMAE